jgi:hypothetical protein
MTPRERVEAALRFEPVDFVPFTVYEAKLIGITEDVPDDRWEETFPTILEACRRHGPVSG